MNRWPGIPEERRLEWHSFLGGFAFGDRATEATPEALSGLRHSVGIASPIGDIPMSIESTLAERGSRYGTFAEQARICQNIKRAMQDSANWASLDDDQRECLEMLAHKASRILNGDPHYHDSWHDIVGYTKLVADRIVA